MLTSWPIIEAEMHDVLQRAGGRPGHIFNLGHRVSTATDADLLRRLVDAVHETTQR
jgi:uroporphyrinogen decarboxylase